MNLLYKYTSISCCFRALDVILYLLGVSDEKDFLTVVITGDGVKVVFHIPKID